MAKEKENFKGMKKEELKKKLVDLQENVRVLRFKGQGSKSKNVKESGALRKKIARVLTELNNKK
ncbi:MAG: 50S ribosomal protein L29 [Candidatus Paceibacterota bacterium]|jgi:ribosomal protein L29